MLTRKCLCWEWTEPTVFKFCHKGKSPPQNFSLSPVVNPQLAVALNKTLTLWPKKIPANGKTNTDEVWGYCFPQTTRVCRAWKQTPMDECSLWGKKCISCCVRGYLSNPLLPQHWKCTTLCTREWRKYLAVLSLACQFAQGLGLL